MVWPIISPSVPHAVLSLYALSNSSDRGPHWEARDACGDRQVHAAHQEAAAGGLLGGRRGEMKTVSSSTEPGWELMEALFIYLLPKFSLFSAASRYE